MLPSVPAYTITMKGRGVKRRVEGGMQGDIRSNMHEYGLAGSDIMSFITCRWGRKGEPISDIFFKIDLNLSNRTF